MPQRVIADIAELKSLTGQDVAISDWLEMTQERINTFADATGDHQWIHVDVEKCKTDSPFKTTIAHGYLTMSLISQFSFAALHIQQKFSYLINYGCNKVRFTSPVKCGAQIRSRHKLLEVTDVTGGWQAAWQVTIEIDGQDKPACVAETLGRYYA